MTNCQVTEDSSICFNFWFEMTHSSGIEKLEIHLEGQRDLTRIKVWEFQQKHLDFWEEGRVKIGKLAHEDFKIVIVAERELFSRAMLPLMISTLRRHSKRSSAPPSHQ